MTRREPFERRLLVSVDARGYGTATGSRQRAMQTALVAFLDEAAAQVGLDRTAWNRQPGGDGELALLPPSESEVVLIDDFVPALGRLLRPYNEDRQPEARLRLRMAVHHGVAFPGDNGFVGAGAVTVSRLVNSLPAHQVQQAAQDVDLVVVLSGGIVNENVAQRHTALRVEHLLKVRVSVKEYTDYAWLYVPGVRPDALRPLLDPDVRPRSDGHEGGASPPGPDRHHDRPGRRPAAGQVARSYHAEVVNEFHGPATAEVIGIQKLGRDG